MAEAGPSSHPGGVQFAASESSGSSPAMIGKDSSFFEVSSRRREVLAAKGVVDEVRRRVVQLRGGQAKAEREREEKAKEEKLEKARAAAWAWYQHGKGGKESISSSSSSIPPSAAAGVPTLPIRSGELGHKSSRFKTEALKSSGHQSIDSASTSTSVESGHHHHHHRTESASRWRTESGRSWDFSNVPVSVSRTSSLFDSYELDSVSRRIDTAFLGDGPFHSPTSGRTVVSRPSFKKVPKVEVGPPEIQRATGLPAPMRPAGASTSAAAAPPAAVPRVISTSVRVSQELQAASSPKVSRSSSMRMHFPRCICSSISDVVSHEEMAIGIDIAKCDCPQHRAGNQQTDGNGWSLRRITRAIQELIHLPETEYHPQQEHHERRLARLHLHHHFHHHHRHDHEYHHHLHYRIKLRDGVHHGNSFSTNPGKPNPCLVEVPKEKSDYQSFPRLSSHSRSSPKVSPKLV